MKIAYIYVTQNILQSRQILASGASVPLLLCYVWITQIILSNLSENHIQYTIIAVFYMDVLFSSTQSKMTSVSVQISFQSRTST